MPFPAPVSSADKKRTRDAGGKVLIDRLKLLGKGIDMSDRKAKIGVILIGDPQPESFHPQPKAVRVFVEAGLRRSDLCIPELASREQPLVILKSTPGYHATEGFSAYQVTL